jgi:hypothetical protein
MTNPRINFTSAQQTILLAQVSGLCPLCDIKLHKENNGQSRKHYDLAHIYPLNPSVEEKVLLRSEKRLSDDVNHENNLIPMCKQCHGIFDKPRTLDAYRKVFEIKNKLIKNTIQTQLWHNFHIEEEVSEIIKNIYADSQILESINFNMTAKLIDSKLNDSINTPTKIKINMNVVTYYYFVKNQFNAFNKATPNFSDMVSSQVRLYFLKLDSSGYSQQQIFEGMVEWIRRKTNSQSIEGAEIISSFFIQNCEIFK